MFAAKTPPSAIRGCVLEALSAQTRTKGGVRDTLVNAETVMPWMRSPERAVTMVTPLGQWRRPSRNSSSVTGKPVLQAHALWRNVPGGRLPGTKGSAPLAGRGVVRLADRSYSARVGRPRAFPSPAKETQTHERWIQPTPLHPALRSPGLVSDQDVRLEGHAHTGANRGGRGDQARDLRRVPEGTRRGRPAGAGGDLGGRAVRCGGRARRGQAQARTRDVRGEKRPGRVRLRVWRRLRQAHRGLQPDLLQGARALQPR